MKAALTAIVVLGLCVVCSGRTTTPSMSLISNR